MSATNGNGLRNQYGSTHWLLPCRITHRWRAMALCQSSSLAFAGTLVALLWVALSVGCGKQRGGDWNQTFPVSGKLFVKSKPANGAIVVLHPLSSEGTLLKGSQRPNGIVRDDGAFQVTTYTTGDGAPVGKYAVTVTWPSPSAAATPDERGPDQLKNRYSDPKSPFTTVIITAEENTLQPFQIE